jgi:hypothetical protein
VVPFVAKKLVVVRLVKIAVAAFSNVAKKLVVVAFVRVAFPDESSLAAVTSVQAEPFQNNILFVAVHSKPQDKLQTEW